MPRLETEPSSNGGFEDLFAVDGTSPELHTVFLQPFLYFAWFHPVGELGKRRQTLGPFPRFNDRTKIECQEKQAISSKRALDSFLTVAKQHRSTKPFAEMLRFAKLRDKLISTHPKRQ
jgi:hypothetical protein